MAKVGGMREGVTIARSRRPRRWPPLALLRTVAQPVLLVLFLGVGVLFALLETWSSTWAPPASASLCLLAAGFVLRVRYLLAYFVFMAVTVAVVSSIPDSPSLRPGTLLVLGLSGAMVWRYALGRQRLGVQGALGTSMLVDLRDRLRAQGVVPPLEPGWQVESVLRAAHGDSFSGDFLVASRSPDNRTVELVLVDVSGKGQPAGTRALMLSGAFGGLLGALPPAEFLPSANRYLLRQQWSEGFATAVHVSLDLDTGAYRLAGAGHPPAAHFHTLPGRWQLLEGDQGPLLGVVEEPSYPAQEGVLDPGDTLLLYTDGLVESPEVDVARGIDRLVALAQQAMRGGFRGGAARIVDSLRGGDADDRALVVIRRS